MKKISFKFEEQTCEDTWRPVNAVDNTSLETDLNDPKELLSLVQDEIDLKWNSRLRSHENPRRATEVVKVEYIPPVKKKWDNFDDYEDDEDEYDENYED